MKGPYEENSDLAGVDFDQKFNFKCKYCKKNLSSRQNLREHMYVHTGEKPYICTELGCGKSFRQGSLLSIHKKVHSEIFKSLKTENKVERKTQYPKLTKLIEITKNNLDFTLQDFEKDEWIRKIDPEDFKFMPRYLQSTSNY
ncbi:hypothetical protein SteCoe_20668 [Stentor coeruleus]|uniref:C2H2-type domain-containing protein n=1 Tax=Stentor coeruleus TaxID=5963 RepID=A0A1R2BRQ4_9CILI|nr:hypothetical protein SteCoe_20668 [Stentor coeruleus]